MLQKPLLHQKGDDFLWQSGLLQIGTSHLNHNKDFIWQARGFDSVEEMNKQLIKRHNKLVTAEDDIYVLGDLCMSTDLIANKNLIEQFNGKLHVIWGNHCTKNRMAMYEDCKNIIEICGYATMLKYKKYHFYLSHYPTLTDNYDDGESLKAKVINLCGHSHYTNPLADLDKGTIFHVEVDGNNCCPWDIEDIIKSL